MNNRMSYNDVQQLKNHIRTRLQEANMQNNVSGYGMPVGGQRPPAGGRIAQANQRAAQSMQNVNNAGYQQGNPQNMRRQPMQYRPMRGGQTQAGAMQTKPMQGQVMQATTMQSQSIQSHTARTAKTKTQTANNVTPQLEKQITKVTEKQQGGVHFDKYDCGHPYPKMSVRKHLREEMNKSRNERIDSLRYAYVMSEILSEPVCKRRRSR